MHKNQFKLLTTRRFLPLFIAQSTQGFNDSAFRLTVLAMISFYLTSSAEELQRWQSLAILLYNLPFILFASMAGQLADKYRKELVLQIVKFLELFLVAGAFVVLYYSSIPWMMAAVFLFGTHTAFVVPVKFALLPQLIDNEELLGANALFEAGLLIAITTGNVLGTTANPTSGMHYVNVMIIFVIALCGWIASLYIPRTAVGAPETKIKFNPFTVISESFHFSRVHREVFLAMVGIGWFWFVGASFTIEYPLYVKYILHGKGPIFTYYMGIFTLGIMIGTLIVNKILDGKITTKFVPVCLMVMMLASTDLYWAGFAFKMTDVTTLYDIFHQWRYWRLSVDIISLSCAMGIYLVPLYATLQALSDVETRARVMAANTMLYASFMLVASVFLFVLKWFEVGVPTMFLIIGIINLFMLVYLMPLVPKQPKKTVCKSLLAWWFKIEVKGLDNYMTSQRVVLIANQTSTIDVLLLSAFLPDELTLALEPRVAKRYWVRIMTSLLNLLQVDPSTAKAARVLVRAAKKGEKVLIFPESRLSGGASFLKLYEGAGFVIDKSGADILPIRIEGAERSIFSLNKARQVTCWRPKITLHIEPVCAIEQSLKCSVEKRRMRALTLYNILSDMSFNNSPTSMSLFESLLRARKKAKRGAKIIEDVQRAPLTLSQFVSRSFILGKQIKRQTKVGECVGVLMPTTVAGMVTFFAMQAYRRTPAMLNFTSGIFNLYSSCQTAKIQTIYTSKKFIHTAKIEETVKQLEDNGLRIIYLEDFKDTIKLTEKLAGLIKGLVPRLTYRLLGRRVNSSETGVILFTSGSEGVPKGVALSHENILSNVYQMIAKVDFSPNDIFFNSLPVFHSFGLTAGSLLPLLAGNPVFYYPSPLHYKIIPGLVYDTSATIMLATDTFLTGYAHYANDTDFNSIRYIFAGAEKVKPQTITHWSERFGARVFEGYGATEASPVIAVNTPMANKKGSVGQLLSCVSHRVEAVEGIERGGRLFIKGPNVMKGYLRADNPGVLEALGDAWYDTGDVVEVDEQGFVIILGRAKRFAKLGGEMVSLTSVESALSAVWPEEMHAAVIKHHVKKGEEIVVFTECDKVNKKALVAYIRTQGLSELLVPKHIHMVDKVPVLASGKIDYVTIEKTLLRDV